MFYFVFSPFIWLLNKSSNLILRILGIKKVGEDDVHSEEELRMILTESEEGGAIKPSENELIQNVFDFDAVAANVQPLHSNCHVGLLFGIP